MWCRWILAVAILLSTSVLAQPLQYAIWQPSEQPLTASQLTALDLYFSEQLQQPVQRVPISSGQQIVDKMVAGELDFGWVNLITSYQLRRALPEVEHTAQGYDDQFYRFYIVARTATGLKPQQWFDGRQLAPFRIALGPKNSSSSNVLPQYYLEQLYQQKVSDMFRSIRYFRSQQQILAELKSGQVDVGAVSYQVYQQAVRDGSVDPSDIRIIWTSPMFPNNYWMTQPAGSYSTALQQALAQLHLQPQLQGIEPRGFVSVDAGTVANIDNTLAAAGVKGR
ncbi:PhnD/SsuA/transferrin family substrate-binding protein [uncultured Ferrimonas sp.]|uniref:phosphate/phosphite/phosphonate ABC transporter substrate-binding protein n=1 Tax=uncultured Ferrimonas sp. TaxID=432640 RepID=UPI002614D086|nr:PhnD/SsuA/transferrin family substrate-binding protein [uncultured Ferrimonas sp.]